jgi:predicted NUDIX family NTP pyrophosphohydrolase
LNRYISTNYVFNYTVRHKNVFLFHLADENGELNNFEFNCSSYFDDGEPEIYEYKWFDVSEIEKFILPSQRGILMYLERKKEII